MEVLFVSTFPPLPCGIGTYTEMLINSLIKSKKDIHVSILTEKSVGNFESEGLRVISCFDSKENFVDPILEKVKKIQPDVVHIQHDYTRYSPHERFIELLEGLSSYKTFVTMHAVLTRETSDYHPYCEKLNRRIGELARIIVHQETAKQVLLRMGVPSKRVKIIPHGTLLLNHRSDKKGCFNLSEESQVLAQFGFLKEQKQIHISIKAMPLVLERFPNAHLFIGGSIHPYYREDKKYQEYIEYCLDLIGDLGISKNVCLLNDFLSPVHLEKSICSADIILFPEKMNYWSVSGMLHLALGAGKPIIATRCPKFEEISRYVSDELVFTPGDYKQMAKIAIRILDDPDFRKFAIKRIKKLALKTAWSRIAEMHIDVYSE